MRPSKASPKGSGRGRHREVAILIETTNPYARNLLLGVTRYIRERAHWSYYLIERRWGENPLPWLASWHGDGVIARIETHQIARAVAKTGLPAVDLSPSHLVPSIPCFAPDSDAIAKLAVDHFLERGFKTFAFCGEPRFGWAASRERSFARRLRREGFDYSTHSVSPEHYDPHERSVGLRRWLRQLPKPVAVLACYDRLGLQVLDACRDEELAVPSEVAVLGVDNDRVLCNLAVPPLSSILDNARGTGYEAAALLDRMLSGERVDPTTRHVAPLGIEARQSTDVLAVEDRNIALAAQFIRDHACEGIRIADILRVVPLSRRVLEERFQRSFGVSPRQEIQRVRLNRVRELLAETDLPVYQIAERTGFENTEYLSVVFKRETGTTPREFRARTAPSKT